MLCDPAPRTSGQTLALAGFVLPSGDQREGEEMLTFAAHAVSGHSTWKSGNSKAPPASSLGEAGRVGLIHSPASQGQRDLGLRILSLLSVCCNSVCCRKWDSSDPSGCIYHFFCFLRGVNRFFPPQKSLKLLCTAQLSYVTAVFL